HKGRAVGGKRVVAVEREEVVLALGRPAPAQGELGAQAGSPAHAGGPRRAEAPRHSACPGQTGAGLARAPPSPDAVAGNDVVLKRHTGLAVEQGPAPGITKAGRCGGLPVGLVLGGKEGRAEPNARTVRVQAIIEAGRPRAVEIGSDDVALDTNHPL